jgi:predicted SAM-dependent methyltransferase
VVAINIGSYPRTWAGLLKLNLGCGDYPLDGFINVDSTLRHGVNAVINVPPLPWPDASVSEIYAGHFLEHLDFADGGELLRECSRVLVSGGSIGVVVPDFHEIARRYVMDAAAPFEWADGTHDMTDLDEVCHYLLFSTCQPSHHRWAYDLTSLGRALMRAGFDVTGEIDRMGDPRLSTPRWYQCGLNASKP